jgi:hypothetical protein
MIQSETANRNTMQLPKGKGQGINNYMQKKKEYRKFKILML